MADARLNPAKQRVRAALESGALRYWLEAKLPADALEWLLDAVARQTLTPKKYRATNNARHKKGVDR